MFSHKKNSHVKYSDIPALETKRKKVFCLPYIKYHKINNFSLAKM